MNTFQPKALDKPRLEITSHQTILYKYQDKKPCTHG